jgi:uncharacterized protein YfaQ (DUF2300 family)
VVNFISDLYPGLFFSVITVGGGKGARRYYVGMHRVQKPELPDQQKQEEQSGADRVEEVL